MAAPARAFLCDLPKGHEFPQTAFVLSADDLARYLDAVEDANAVYGERQLAPPLAVAARALASLLGVVELTAGSLHTGQEVEARTAVPFDSTLTLSGRIAQRSKRAGFVISILEFNVTPAGASEPALRGRTTVIAPANET